MNGYVVTEGSEDAALFSRILKVQSKTKGIKVVAGGGRSGMISLAQSLLVSRPSHVAIVADSETTDESQAVQQTFIWSDLLRGASPVSDFRIFLAVPEIESVFFKSPEFFKDHFKIKLSTEDRVFSRVEPKRVMQRILPGKYRSQSPGWRQRFYASLPAAACKDLLRTSLLEDVVNFLLKDSGREA